MKKKIIKREEALSRREKDLLFWENGGRSPEFAGGPGEITKKIEQRIKIAKQDIKNLRKKLG
jgi:hypothetical protein